MKTAKTRKVQVNVVVIGDSVPEVYASILAVYQNCMISGGLVANVDTGYLEGVTVNGDKIRVYPLAMSRE